MKIGIISSVVATFLFIYFLDPLLRFITLLLFKTFGSLAHKYTDRLFEQSALLIGPDPSYALFIFINSVLFGMFVCVIIFSLFMDRILDNLIDGPTECPKDRPPKDRPENCPLNRRTEESKRYKVLGRVILIVSSFIAIILIILTTYSMTFQIRITTSFSQHVVLLAPYISDQEAKLLRSRWVQMKSEQDFDAIYKDLNKIAKINGVTLPENKVYSFSSL
jgi:hypothetical protein